jgi:hypothetical protein
MLLLSIVVVVVVVVLKAKRIRKIQNIYWNLLAVRPSACGRYKKGAKVQSLPVHTYTFITND